MKKILATLLMMCATTITMWAQTETIRQQQEEAAKGVISRFMGNEMEGGLSVTVSLDLEATSKGCDKFSYTYSDSELQIHASSAVAACRGFYDFVKSNGAGICSWSGSRFAMPTNVTTTQKTVTSPYRDHQYLNVVTYGYSMPYWDEERWDKELDWMALHGIDMPLMLLASEAIYRQVFTEKGLTKAQLDEWEVGPAHLPWMRMGNLAGNSFDGPLGQPWHDRQIKLAHHVLGRMKELGMKPIVPAFGGFVPKAYAQKLGSGKYVATGWNWVPESYRNFRITPAVPEFKEIGKRFIELWDAEFEPTFGEFKYYLSDSFNEMDVPNDLDLLQTYGKNIYDAIIEGSNNPEAVWVTQGWEFVYGRGKWSSAKYEALRKDCAPHQFMSLYMAPEYGGYQWSYYDNFHGDDWNYTMLPNMGGKNFWTGRLQNYTNDYPRNLAQGGAYSNCTGWGLTMEGIEYNELLYELITDMGWTSPTAGPAVETWMNNYGKARFGEAYDQTFKNLYTALRNTVYNSYIDHQCFAWQGNNRSSNYYEAGNINTTTDAFFQGFDQFFSEANVNKLKEQGTLPATLRADIIEFAAFYAAANVSKLCKRIIAAKNSGKMEEAQQLVDELTRLMTNMDYMLTGHPLYDEAKWEEKARKLAGGDATVEKKYVKNARRIVSTWYGAHSNHEPVNDYASRIYAGIIRDYYLPRLRTEMTNMLGLTNKSLRSVEINFIPNGNNTTAAPALSAPRHYFAQDGSETIVSEGITLENTSDVELLSMAKALVDEAREAGTFTVSKDPFMASNDTENHWYYIHSNNPNKLDYVLTSTGDQTLPSAEFAAQQLTGKSEQMWRFIQTGTNTYRLENRNGQNFAYDNNKMMTYQANIFSDVYVEKDEVNNRWILIPASLKSIAHNAIHFNNSNVFTLWSAKENGQYMDNSTWTIEATDASAVPDDAEFSRFVRRLSGFQTARHGDETLYGQPGQPLGATSLAKAISTIDHRIDALTTYSEYLGIYRKAINDNFNLQGITGNQEATNLFELILSAFMLDPSINTSESVNEAFHTALIEAQQTLANVGSKSAAQLKTAHTALSTAIKTFIESPGDAADLKSGAWTPELWKTATSAQNTSNFYEAASLDITGVSVSSKGNVTVTIKYTSGNHRQVLYGAELVNTRGEVVYHDYHLGSAGGAHTNNVYTLKSVEPGTYTVRCWSGSRSDNDYIDCSGTVTVAGAASKTFNYTKQTWIVDNSLLTDELKASYTTRVGTNNYKYLDIENVNVAQQGTLNITYKYSSGSERLDIIGVELLDSKTGKLIETEGTYDAHYGFTGTAASKNSYSILIPQGTYTIRTWAMYTRTLNSSGNITYSFTKDATAINQLHSSSIHNDKYYDLNGLPVTSPRKGQLVLHNGKKVIL